MHLFLSAFLSDFLQSQIIYCVLVEVDDFDICMDNKNICGDSGDWC